MFFDFIYLIHFLPLIEVWEDNVELESLFFFLDRCSLQKPFLLAGSKLKNHFERVDPTSSSLEGQTTQ